MDPLHLNWERYAEIVHRLADDVRRDGVPQWIVAVQRGGLLPAAMLAYAFAIRSVTSIALERTVDDAPNAQKRTPTINETPWLACIRDMDVLLVDDVLGTGLTLATATSIVTAYKPRSLRSLVSVVNVANADAAHTVDVTYVGMRTDRWVTFPWEIVHAES